MLTRNFATQNYINYLNREPRSPKISFQCDLAGEIDKNNKIFVHKKWKVKYSLFVCLFFCIKKVRKC